MNILVRIIRTCRTKSARNVAMGLAASTFLMSPAFADDVAKIGFVSTFTGANSTLGRELLDGFNLAVKMGSGQLGGYPVEVITADDQQDPGRARQATERLIERERVDLVTGVVFGNILPVVAQATVDLDRIFLSINGGAGSFAGENCHPDMFFGAWQTDTPHEAIGAFAQKEGYKNVYIMAPDYAPGYEMVAGFKRHYTGEIVGEAMTPMSQMDFAAELAQVRRANPDALYIFYPGGLGVSFLKQFEAAGLNDVQLIGASFTFDDTILPSVGDAAIGAKFSAFWGAELDNPANKEFVAAYTEEYGRAPSGLAAQGYDGARMIGAALEATGGAISDKELFRKALAEVQFDSVRGPFQFNKNHFPIQNWYWGEVVKGDNGISVPVTRGVIFENHADPFVDKCQMN